MKNKINTFVNKYCYIAEWSEKDGVYVAKALEVPSILAHASTAEEAIKQVKIPLVLALKSLLNDGQELPGPISLNEFTGNIELQTSPENHKELTLRAAESGMSLNQYILLKLA